MEQSTTALRPRQATRQHRYSLAEVLAYTQVPDVRVKRWLAAGIIQPVGGGGSQGVRREFSLKNLIEIVCCNTLHMMGLTEPARQIFVQMLRDVWARPTMPISNQDPASLLWRDAPFLWFGIQTGMVDDEWQETLGLAPCDFPTLQRYITGDLGSNLPALPLSGIVIPLQHITRELEARTGDVLVWG